MSVLIKGMKMPKSCSECPLNYDQMACDATGTAWWSDAVVLMNFDSDKERLYNCPLIEVKTPHGRLIDADKLSEKAYWDYNEATHDFTVFGLEHDGVFESPLNEGQQMTPQEAIEKLKAYEEKQKADELKVGDEVEHTVSEYTSKAIFLEKIKDDEDWYKCLFWTGCGLAILSYPKKQFKPTGKHYDIDKILEGMKE